MATPPDFTAGSILTAAQMNAVGLWRVTTCTVTSAGGTPATASNGVVTIGSGNTSITVANAFSTNYDNYLIVLSGSSCSIDGQGLKLTLSGVTGNNYFIYSLFQAWGTAAPSATGYNSNNSGFLIGFGGTTSDTNTKVELFSPFLSTRTGMTCHGSSSTYYTNGSGLCDSTVSSTGFTIDPDGTATLSGGKIRVYGYNK